MAVWLIRSGRQHEQQEKSFLHNGIISVGWELPDLTQYLTKKDISHALTKKYPDEIPGTIKTWTSELWTFSRDMAISDIVVLPMRGTKSIYIGRVTSDYLYETNAPGFNHIHKVEWVDDFPRKAFTQETQRSFHSRFTVCRIRAHNAEELILKIIR